ncbi:protein disulfide oxidoreductase [Thermosipho atlanticus]|uniref:Glutaredoxin-like domain protein n=1 Tax=Thermosipho atlanticus DSM 15807 TaxID=1123380 RepID=A0A1M5T103_9BACT|nr:thioredoxin family protein [Thermosipho atlanticus]SHH44310.1 Glutaredoxin-like domain protein [Thermosipho atlanticus DSM 15807]
MALLSAKDREYLIDTFSKELKNNVKLIYFGDSKENCEYCELEEQILDELQELSNKIVVERYNVNEHNDLAKKYEVEMTPALILTLEDGEDKGVRFYGLPSGHEFGTLVQDIITFGKGATPELSPSTIEKLQAIDKPVKISVFVTPTCPYCPKAVLTAHNFALVNPLIKAEMIEANEFFELSNEFGVSSVPHIVINRNPNTFFIGAYPEAQYLEEVLKAIK